MAPMSDGMPILTPDGRRRFAPEPGRKKGIALCLSGGGFRAALFHLGALRRLNELGVLQQVETVASVSGGSTVAAHLARHHHVWKDGCSADTWEQTISAPFRRFASRNFSTPSVLYGYPRPWSNAGVDSFARACARELYPDAASTLPSKPDFQFCATELFNGRACMFNRAALETPGQPIREVGQAVAISSAFPLIFWPYRQSRPFQAMYVDGGVADNRGIEQVWRTHHTLLVSDGGDVLRPGWSQAFTYPWFRSLGILMSQMNTMQQRWLVQIFQSGVVDGTFWSVGSAVEHYRVNTSMQVRGYAADVARDYIAQIRLKYDVFSDAEAAILENHGYTLADIGVRTHTPRLVVRDAEWSEPHPYWLDDARAREALRNSDTSSVGGHGWIRACVRAMWRHVRHEVGGDAWKVPPPSSQLPRGRGAIPSPVGAGSPSASASIDGPVAES